MICDRGGFLFGIFERVRDRRLFVLQFHLDLSMSLGILREKPMFDFYNLQVGTRIRSKFPVQDDGDDGPRVGPAGSIGVIEAVFRNQEHCYSVAFDNGVTGFYSPLEVIEELEIVE